METKELTVWDVIKQHTESAQLQSRLVGSAPTNEWTGLATKELIKNLDKVHTPYQHFHSDVKGQPLYGKLCVSFVTFGKTTE